VTVRVYVNGTITDESSAVISVFDRGFLYGDSVYEVLRTAGGRAVDFDRHLGRLARSAGAIALALPAEAEIRRAVADTLAAAANPEAYIRIVVTRGAGRIALDMDAADTPSLLVITQPLKMPRAELYTEGARLAIVGVERTSRRAVDPAVKSGNYLNSIMALAEAQKIGAYEALMLGPDGRVAEGSTSNVFAVRAGALTTPALQTGILAGITRQRVIELAREMGLEAGEGDLYPDDLRGADEVFITSSIRGVMPVNRVDDRAISGGAPGPITRRLMDAHDRFIANVAAGSG
jgi:branched-chain amino acid aminotransferase